MNISQLRSWQRLAACWSVCLVIGLARQDSVAGQEGAAPRLAAQEVAVSGRHWNLPTRTLGGQQFWTDHRWHNGLRLQHNHVTDHWRLIDERDIRRAWGSREAC